MKNVLDFIQELFYTVVAGRELLSQPTRPLYEVAALVPGFGGFFNGYRHPQNLTIPQHGNPDHL